jgi:oligoendopeptidase F
MNHPKTGDEELERLAKDYAESCDNESGGFLTHQLEAIRKKAFLAGYRAAQSQTKSLKKSLKKQLSEALQEAAKVEWPDDLIKELIDNCEASTAETDISDERKAYRKDLLARAKSRLKNVEE